MTDILWTQKEKAKLARMINGYEEAFYKNKSNKRKSILFDEFRIRISSIQSKVRKNFAQFLIKLLNRIDPVELQGCIIDDEVKIKLRYYVPQDGNWYHFAMMQDCWINLKVKVKRKKRYLNGESIKRKTRKRKSND